MELKTAFVEHLPHTEQRTVLFNGLDALQAILSSIPEVISVEARVETETPPGREALDRLRLRQMLLIRIGQWVLVVAVIVSAILAPSAVTVLTAVLVGMLTLAELAVIDLDPYKQLRPAFSWGPVFSFAGWVRRRIFGSRKSPPHSVVRAKANVLVDEQRLRSAVRKALGHLDETLGAPVPPPPLPPADITLLKLLQQLLGSTLSGDSNDLHQTLQIEAARLRHQLGIEVSSEWTPETSPDYWEIRESPAVTSPKTILPAVWQKDRVIQGVVYLPASKES